MKTFTVYGGCITRDCFRYLDNEIYKPVLTIGQNQIATMFDSPFKTEIDDYVEGSNFEKKMLYYDSNKLALEKILEQNSDYFIFDVISERVTIMEFALGDAISRVEKSYKFIDNWYKLLKNEKYLGLKKIRDINTFDLDETYEDKIDIFCKKILEKYGSDKIIFLELKLSNEYVDSENTLRAFNEENGYKIVSPYNMPLYGNAVIERVESRIKKNLPNIYYIPLPDYTLANEKHHFGLHPLHLMDEYYLYASTAIELIVESGLDKNIELSLQKLNELQTKNNQAYRKKILKVDSKN